MEYQALYRQFRPRNFDEIVEQKAAVATLRKTVLTGKIGHAYLFCGQRGTGKTSIARVFARAINCENPVNGNPCNECPTCKGILDGSLMDVIEIDAASNRSIDNIRSICEEVSYAPSRAKYKVYIIDEVHMITAEAFNALLKTLEEPPAHAVFLFATTEPHAIPPTILSRCQRFDFRRISTNAIKSRLAYICKEEKIKAQEDALDLIASMSDGAMRDAISFLDQASAMASGLTITPESIEEMTGTVNIDFIADFAQILINGRFDQLPGKCKELSDSGRDFIQFTLDLADYFRNLLVLRVVPDPSQLVTASAKTLKRMYETANMTNSQTLVGFVSSFSKIVSDLKWSPSVRTSFEIAMMRLCGRKVRMEEAPLVIPDFEKLQAKAAKSISEQESAPVTSPVAEPEEGKPDGEQVQAEDEAAEEPVTSTLEDMKASLDALTKKPSVFSKGGIPPIARGLADSEEKKEPEKTSEPVKEEEPETKEPKAEESKAEEPKKEEPKEEEKPAAIPEPVTTVPDAPAAPAVEEPIDEEDKPMENQIGLFFDDNDAGKAPKVGIFANLSDSVLDDISIDDLKLGEETSESDKEEEYSSVIEEDDDLQAPTGRIGETRRSALSTAVDQSPIVRAKKSVEESDPRKIWLEIRTEVYESDKDLGLVLEKAALNILGEGAYITINSDNTDDARELGKDQGFKRVCSMIKGRIPGIVHVFSCTPRQFANMQKKYAEEQKKKETPVIDFAGGASDPAADFIKGLGEAGLNTEIHFGDQ